MSRTSTGHSTGHRTTRMGARCPTCGRSGTPVLFGLPDRSADEAAEHGRLILRGCIQPEEVPQWECPAGHEWSGDEQVWEAAVKAAVSGRPHCRVCGGPTRYLVYPGAEELFLEELAGGDAELATEPGGATTNFARICRSCRTVG